MQLKASRRVHVAVGVPAGAAVAAYAARNEHGSAFLLESIGGSVGGYVGALVPDVLEPAVSSWHRSVCHSWVAVGVGVKSLPEHLARWQAYCRAHAAEHERRRDASDDAMARAWHAACAIFWLLVSGFALGLVAGYASHVALDAATPRGLPLLT